MTIIIVTDYAFVAGGAGQVALLNAVEMARAGFEVILFTAVGPVEPALEGIPNLTVFCLGQYDILNHPNRIKAAITGVWNQEAARRLAKILASHNPGDTVVHIHSLSKALSSSIVRVCHIKGYKMIYHLHDYAAACPNMGFFCFPSNRVCTLNPFSLACILRQCDRRNYLHKLWRLVRQAAQQTVGGFPRYINHFIAVSEFSRKILAPHLPSATPLSVVVNPIDIIKKTRVRAENNQAFIYIGRLDKEKNPHILARAASRLALPVIFVGEGECRQEIAELNPDAVITGWLPHADVQKLIETARALVLPSNWYETQGLVVAEAGARGVPAIVSDVCAATEFINDAETGLRFVADNESDLIDKINRLNDDHVVKSMSQAVYKRYWADPPGADKYIAHMAEIYAEVLGRQHAQLDQQKPGLIMKGPSL